MVAPAAQASRMTASPSGLSDDHGSASRMTASRSDPTQPLSNRFPAGKAARRVGTTGYDTPRNREQRRQSECNRAFDDQRVMTKRQCAEVNGISIWTLERLLKAGKGPVITQTSDRRIGITVANNRAWQQSRERTSANSADATT